MMRGLFIGIDHYKTPVNRLTCATNDAQALSALFEDTLDGEVALLVDDAATRQNILEELTLLSDSHPDDLVVVSFSGHGTPDHDLVPVDVDPCQRSSMLPLDDIASMLDRVPAEQLLVILDCCFSGGFGGERVFAPTAERAMIEDRTSLAHLGRGRVVITASDAGEPALETAQLRHGLLTYHLLVALQGPAELGDEPHLPLPLLLQFATRAVMDEAARLGAVQTPTVYGSIRGDARLPKLIPGERWAALFPSRSRPPATIDWGSLSPYGLPQAAIERWKLQMPSLNELQLEAINGCGVLDGANLVVVAPTSSGKTLIGELAAVKAGTRGGRSVILLPLKALVNDKYEAFRSTYGDELEIVRATGDHADQIGAFLGGHYDIALLTYEKFTSLVLANPHIMRAVEVAIVDEAQMIGDRNRGSNLEFALTLLRRGHGSSSPCQLILLSGVIGDTAGLDRWLAAKLLRTDERPVPLSESVIDASGTRRQLTPEGDTSVDRNYFVSEFGWRGSTETKPHLIGLVRKLVGEGKKVIVFRNFKGLTSGTALYLATALDLPGADEAIEALPTGDVAVSSRELRTALAGGVAFHNADLDAAERAVVESVFRDPASPLRVVVATTTLAMGINTPAEAVVIAGLKHPGNVDYTTAEYKNMVGRAGRLGQAEAGEAYLLATDGLSPASAWAQFVNGALEPIRSRLLEGGTEPQTVILRTLVALGGSTSEADLIDLVESSFAVWQLQAGHDTKANWSPSEIEGHLTRLIETGFVDNDPGDNLVVTALGRFAGESGVEVTSLVWLAEVISRATPPFSDSDLITLSQLTRELDAVNVPRNARSRQEQSRWPLFLRRSGVQQPIVSALHVGGGDTLARAKRAAAAVLYASDTPLNGIEENLMQHCRDASAAGPVRQVASRSRDLIDAVATVALFRAGVDCMKMADELSIRLEFGVPARLVPLAEVLGSELHRGQYLSLLRMGLADPAALLQSSDAMTGEILESAERAKILELLRDAGN